MQIPKEQKERLIEFEENKQDSKVKVTGVTRCSVYSSLLDKPLMERDTGVIMTYKYHFLLVFTKHCSIPF